MAWLFILILLPVYEASSQEPPVINPIDKLLDDLGEIEDSGLDAIELVGAIEHLLLRAQCTQSQGIFRPGPSRPHRGRMRSTRSRNAGNGGTVERVVDRGNLEEVNGRRRLDTLIQLLRSRVSDLWRKTAEFSLESSSLPRSVFRIGEIQFTEDGVQIEEEEERMTDSIKLADSTQSHRETTSPQPEMAALDLTTAEDPPVYEGSTDAWTAVDSFDSGSIPAESFIALGTYLSEQGDLEHT